MYQQQHMFSLFSAIELFVLYNMHSNGLHFDKAPENVVECGFLSRKQTNTRCHFYAFTSVVLFSG